MWLQDHWFLVAFLLSKVVMMTYCVQYKAYAGNKHDEILPTGNLFGVETRSVNIVVIWGEKLALFYTLVSITLRAWTLACN